jgi:polyisoprenyl-phosphate glycosyltransferase
METTPPADSSPVSRALTTHLSVTIPVFNEEEPLQLATYLGFIAAGLGFLYLLYPLDALATRFLCGNPAGWTSLAAIVLFLGGKPIVLGILGGYVGYDEVKQRPLYVLEERIGFPDPAR